MNQLFRLSLPLLLLAAFWWLLTDGNQGSWLIGIPTLLAAASAIHFLGNGRHSTLSLPGLLRFIPFFLIESLRGGWEVARRILAPQLRVRPDLTTFRTRLQQPGARLLFANCLCLLPGTLAADLQNEFIVVHMLDSSVDPVADLYRLERAVAAVYGDSCYALPDPGQ